MQADKHAQVAQQLQDRLSSEVDKNRRQLDEFNGLQRALALKDSELQEARMAIKAPLDELEQLRREYENLMREFDTFKRR
jgi:DNA repair exonuclease SbcCD ATPase subunit